MDLRRAIRPALIGGAILLVIGGIAVSVMNGSGGYASSAAFGVLELGLASLLAGVGLVALERRRRHRPARAATITAALTICFAALATCTALVGFAGGLADQSGAARGASSGGAASGGTPVEARITDYLDARWAASAPTVESGDLQGQLVGKLVVVNAVTKELMFHGFFDAHPDQQADTAEDVRMVVLVWPTDVGVGTYNDGATGYRTDYWVRVVDFATKQIVGDAVVAGGDPPDSKLGLGDAYGDPPDLVAYLDGLRSAASPTATP